MPMRSGCAPDAVEPAPGAGDVRYAIYFAPPPQSSWWRFGIEWLGRDAVTGVILPQGPLSGFDAGQLARITAAPRQYGFHATLKAPFRLAAGYEEYDVYRQAAVLAAAQEPITLPALELAVLDGFVVLRPGEASPRINALAAQCVSAFDNLRAAPDRAETERRRQQRLTARQAQLLAEWGYPYVLDEYRFHLTLTGRLAQDEQARVIAMLVPLVRELNREPLVVDALALFVQPGGGAPFDVARRYHFSGGTEIYRDG